MRSQNPTRRRKSNLRRNLLIGLALAASIPPIVLWLMAERLRRLPDPEAGELITEPLGEAAEFVESHDGTSLYAEELGKGPNLVFIPGWFSNTDHWHYQKKAFSGGYRVISYDPRAHRWSGHGDGKPFTLETLARDLKSILDAKAADEPVVLVGHSMGGMTILKFTEMFPEELGERIRAVALVDTSHVPLHRCMVGGSALGAVQRSVVEPLLRWFIRHPTISDTGKNMVIRTSAFLVATRYFGYGKGASLNQMEYIRYMAGSTSFSGALLSGLGFLECSETVSLSALRDSGIPVLMWVGEKDRLTRPEISRQMAGELPDSELRVMENTGHPSFMEAYEEFNRAVERLCSEAYG